MNSRRRALMVKLVEGFPPHSIATVIPWTQAPENKLNAPAA